jgi:AF2212-like
MSKSFRAIIREGKIEPLEEVSFPEGSKVLVTLLADGSDFPSPGKMQPANATHPHSDHCLTHRFRPMASSDG